jgi:hypothetical protein
MQLNEGVLERCDHDIIIDNFAAKPEENHDNPRQDSRCSGRNYRQPSPEYRPVAIPVEPACSVYFVELEIYMSVVVFVSYIL